MYLIRLTKNRAFTDAIFFFLVTLLTTLIVLSALNEKRHRQISRTDRIACERSSQLAANQRRILLALIEFERTEKEDHKLKEDGALLREALRKVPEFDCKKGG